MFFGTTPNIISQFLVREIARIKPARVFVPFAGNFVVEQLAGLADKNIEVHSTDVSLYSRSLGHFFDGRGSEIRVKPTVLETYPSLKDIDEPKRSAVAVLLLGEVAKSATKPHIPFHVNVLRDAASNQAKYVESIGAKIENFKANLGKIIFYGTDGVDVLKTAKPGDLVFYDPPVILGDYEKMFAELESYFDFHTPPYTQMSDAIKNENLAWLTEQKITCYYRTNNPVDVGNGFTEVFRHRYKSHACYCVYSNVDAPKFVSSFVGLKEEVKNIPIILPSDEITENSTVEVLPISRKIANHYRLLWVKKADMKDTGEAYLVMVDKKLIGVLVLMSGMQFGHQMCVILSDPGSPTSKYSRLSKLILYICCTQQMLDEFNEKCMWEHVGFTTRVFTNAAVSMKYRDLFDLAERKQDKSPGAEYANILIYQNKDKILPTFQDGLKAWLYAHGTQKKQ